MGTYIYQEYPKVKYHWSGKNTTVKNAEEEAALGGGWANTPAAFDPHKGARPARNAGHNPARWMEEWSVPGLSPAHRTKIKVQLLRADAAFERSPDPESGARDAMRQAFDGFAGVMFEAGILNEDLLRTLVPELVWDAAIAAAWWRTASETRQDIFPERIGRHWVWRDDSRDWNELFRAEAAEWEARLLEGQPPESPGPADGPAPHSLLQPVESLSEFAPGSTPSGVASGTPGAFPPDESGQFISAAQRGEAVAAYTRHWGCSEAALARTARVNPSDLSKWKKGSLPPKSDKKARIEKALTTNETPIPSRRSPD